MSNAWQMLHVCHGRRQVLQDGDDYLQVQIQGKVVHHLSQPSPIKVLRNLHVGFAYCA